MSTDYYLRRSPDPCPTCGQHRRDGEIHIGLSVGGWVFVWHGYRTAEPAGQPLTTPSEWFAYLTTCTAAGQEIRDEYGHRHTLAEFRERVNNKRGFPPLRHSDLPDVRDCIHAEGDDVAF